MTGTTAITYVNQATVNADLDFTYREEGIDGNYVGIELLDPAAASQTLAVTYANGKISVSLATDGSSVLSTTSDQLKTAFNGVKAANTLTSANTGIWTTGCTIVIGGTTYTGRTTLSTGPAVAYEFLCETDGDTCIDNLVLAITGGAGAGTKYCTGTLKHSLVTAVRSTHTMVATARHAGTAWNDAPCTQPSADVKITGWTATTLGGQTAGVNPTVDIGIHTLGILSNHSGHDGTGILAALAVKFPSDSGGTPGVGTTYDSAATAMGAGWILPDSSVGAITVQNDQPKTAAGTTTITSYEAHVMDLATGGQRGVYSDSAAHLLTACKTFAIQMASQGKARQWAPRAWYSPALYSR